MIQAEGVPAGADSGASGHLPVQITLAEASTESGNINRNFYRIRSQRTKWLKSISREESEFIRLKKSHLHFFRFEVNKRESGKRNHIT